MRSLQFFALRRAALAGSAWLCQHKEAIKDGLKKTSRICWNTQVPPAEFFREADDLRLRRVRRQAQAGPQGIVPDRDGSGGAVEGAACLDLVALPKG